MNSRRLLLLMWIGAVGLQVANQVASVAGQGKTPPYAVAWLPQPHKLLASSVVFTGLFGLAEFAPSLALALGAGVDVAILLGPVVQGKGAGDTLFDRVASLVKTS